MMTNKARKKKMQGELENGIVFKINGTVNCSYIKHEILAKATTCLFVIAVITV